MAPLTPAQQAVVDRAARITREKVAPRAAEYDAAGANPVESWRELQRDGFLAAAIPQAYGGLGLDMATYIAVIRTIAQGCASTAMTVHMHSTVMRFIDALATDAQKRRYFREVVEHGRLFGSWGSEPAVSLSRAFLMETVVTQDGSDYVVNGVKYFCTMALGASQYMVWCALDGGTDMGKSLLQVLVPADAPGISTDGKWDTLGMRATFSPSVSFKDVRVPAEAALGDPGAATRAGVVESFALGYAAVYLGIAESSLAFAIDYAKKRIVKPENIAGGPGSRGAAPRGRAVRPPGRRPAGPRRFGGEVGSGRHARARRPRQPGQVPRHGGRASRSRPRSSRSSGAEGPTRTTPPSAPSATSAPRR